MQSDSKPFPAEFGPREHAVYFGALNEGKWVVTTKAAAHLSRISEGHARKVLHDLHRKGALVRAGKGVYALVPPDALASRSKPSVDPFRVLDQLMAALEVPYYAAYMTAAYLHGAAHQVPFNVDVATPKPRRPLRLGGVRITLHAVPAARMLGTARLRQSGEFVTVSDMEKTLLDCADRLDLCGGAEGLAQVAWELAPKIKAARLREYAQAFRQRPALARLGYVLSAIRAQESGRVPRGAEDVLRPGLPKGRYLLDPARKASGKFIRDWRVRVNADPFGWLRA